MSDDGIDLMMIEMDRQRGDALATLEDGEQRAQSIADSIIERGRLVLYGIGGSHYVNRIAEPLYREAGIECRAMSPSEALMAPLPEAERVALFVSQSGESGEIADLLRTPTGSDRRFGLSLNRETTLTRNVEATIVASGGPENAFAATRSIILTIAMHGLVLDRLGVDAGPLRSVLAGGSSADVAPVADAMVSSDVFLFSGRHAMQGVAESAALSLMELARVPTIGLEGGQFRHGAFEFLRPGVGALLLVSDGPDSASVAALVDTCLAAGCKTAVLNASGITSRPGCLDITFARNRGLAAATDILLTLQHFNIAVARNRVGDGAGHPRFTSKVTI